MAIFGNFKGTTQSEFQIGKSTNGTKISSGTQPSSNLSSGDLWLNSANSTIEVYSGSEWKSIGSTLKELNVDSGTLFVDSSNDTVSIGSVSSNDKLFVNGSLRLGTNPSLKHSGAYLDVSHTNGSATQLRVRDNSSSGSDPIFKIFNANNTSEVFKVTGTTFRIADAYNLPSADGTANQILQTDGSGNVTFVDNSATPGGSNTQIQFNDSGSFGGHANLTFDSSTETLGTTNLSVTNFTYSVLSEDYGLIGETTTVTKDYGDITDEASGDFLNDVVEDTTPQLGGSLDVNGQSIVSVSNGDITITPDGTGSIVLDGLNWPQADGSANQVLQTDGSGNLSFATISGGGGGSYADSNVDTHLNRSSASSGQVLTWNGSDYAWTDKTVDTDTDAQTLNLSGNTLTISGSGSSVDLSSFAGGGGGLSNIVEDTTPQLGGNLDAQSNNITGVDTLRINENGTGLRMTNVGAFDNSGGDFRVFSNGNLILSTNGDSGTAVTFDVTSKDATFTGAITTSDSITATGNVTAGNLVTTGSVTVDRLALSSTQTTVPPLQLTASSLNDGVGALRIDSVEPDIFLNDTDGGFATVTFGAPSDGGIGRVAFGRNSGNDFYLTVRDPNTNSGNWRNDTFVADSSTGNISMGYSLTISNSLAINNYTLPTADGSANQVLQTDGSGTLSFATITDTPSTVYALSGTDIDPANGGIQTKTVAANTTFTESLSSGESVVLHLTAGASYTITWPTMTWVTSSGNTAPTLTADDVLVFWKVGSTLYGAYTGSSA